MTVLSKTFKRGKSVIEPTIMNMTGYVSFWYLLGLKLTWGHAHKTRSWYILGVAFKKSDAAPPSLLYGSPPREYSVTAGD